MRLFIGVFLGTGAAVLLLLTGAYVLFSSPDLNPAATQPPQPRLSIPAAPTEPASTNPAADRDTGPAFPGKQAKDFAAIPGEGVTYNRGVWVTAGLISRAKYGSDRYLCTAVEISNSTAEAVRFSYTDWKLQFPTGVIQEAWSTGSSNDLKSGQLASGGTTSGNVCFEDDIPKSAPLPAGTYVVLLEPDMFSKERIAWVNEIDATTFTPTTTSRTTPTTAVRNGVPAAITGTCDPQGTCSGVQQRAEPKNSAAQLIPVILKEGAEVTVFCQTTGDLKTEIDHPPSNVWYRLANGAYVNSIYITPLTTQVPECTA